MEMFYENMREQWFFDKETKCIYLVSDELDDLTIVQIAEDSNQYYKFYNEYLKWKSDNLPLQLFVQECERYIEKCSEDEMTKLYDEMTIDISMLGLTTKLVWGAEEYNRIIDALKILLAEETIE
jgi:hypothetical protein